MLRTASSILERRKKVTAEELVAGEDLTGKTVVVTGGTSGGVRGSALAPALWLQGRRHTALKTIYGLLRHFLYALQAWAERQ